MSDINVPINCSSDKVYPMFSNHFSITATNNGEIVILFMYRHEDQKQASVIQKIAVSLTGSLVLKGILDQVIARYSKTDDGSSSGNRF